MRPHLLNQLIDDSAFAGEVDNLWLKHHSSMDNHINFNGMNVNLSFDFKNHLLRYCYSRL